MVILRTVASLRMLMIMESVSMVLDHLLLIQLVMAFLMLSMLTSFITLP